MCPYCQSSERQVKAGTTNIISLAQVKAKSKPSDPYPQPFPRQQGKGAKTNGKSRLASGEGFRVGSTALVLNMSYQFLYR